MEAALSQLSQIITELIPESAGKIEFNREKSEFGDFSTNIPMKLAKDLKKSPALIANELVENLRHTHELADILEISSAQGYVNFKFTNDGIHSISKGSEDLKLDIKKGSQIMFEFGQPNTHKAIHIGHIRSGVIGLSLSNLLENLGYSVVRANYFGDVGLQVAKCMIGASIFLSNRNYLDTLLTSEQTTSLEMMDLGKSEEEIDMGEIKSNQKLPEPSEVTIDDIIITNEPTNECLKNIEYLNTLSVNIRAKLIDKFYSFGSRIYKENPNLTEFMRDINKKIYEKDSNEVKFLYEITRKWSIDHQNEVFETLGIRYDRQYPESEIWRIGYELVTRNIGTIFKTDRDNGSSVILDLEKLNEGERKKLKTFVYLTYDGILTYSGKEMGLAKLKLDEYPNLEKIIYTTSVEQSDYFKNAFKALELLGLNPDGKKLIHVAFGWLLRNNKKQSSRMGDSIKGLDVVNEIVNKVKEKMKFEDEEIALKLALASLKFLILSHEVHTDINYDPDTFVSFDGFSGIYVMYAYVRSLSILRDAENWKSYDDLDLTDYSFTETERDLLLHLSNFKQISKLAGESLEPHKICHYVYDLAVLMNKFYSENKILVDENIIRQVRINILKKVSETIKHSMWLLGIDVVEKM